MNRYIFILSLISIVAQADLSVSNSTITSFKKMNDVFKALKIGDPDKDVWAGMIKAEGIIPCQPFKRNVGTPVGKNFIKIEAKDSGVLGDEGSIGQRTLHTTEKISSEGGKYVLRFTYDWVRVGGDVICVYEVFLKKPGGTIVGIAVNNKGEILKNVPEKLAHDKQGNQAGKKDSTIISSGAGCFFCHPGVSRTNDMPGADYFWGARIPANLPHRDSSRQILLRDHAAK